MAFVQGGDAMRSNEELMKGILQRKAVYLAQRQMRRLAMVGAGLATLLIAMLVIVPGITGSEEQYAAYSMGAMILGPETGGYVIVALLAFALGIVVTILIQKHNRLKKSMENGQAVNTGADMTKRLVRGDEKS